MTVLPFPEPAEAAEAPLPARGILPLELEAVSLHLGGMPILDRIALRLGAGPSSVILGANGAGKSMLLRVCHGLLQPTAGRVRWLGARGHDPAPHQVLVFQRPVMLRRSALANVAYGLKLAGVGRRQRRERALDMLNRVGLAHLAERPARTLSGGEQQLVSLARAWALDPEVMFLDEPTASLSPSAARAVEQTIVAIDAAGTKIVMTTHNLGQARRLADEILFLHRGRLVERAPVARFFAAPQTAEAREFLRDMR